MRQLLSQALPDPVAAGLEPISRSDAAYMSKGGCMQHDGKGWIGYAHVCMVAQTSGGLTASSFGGQSLINTGSNGAARSGL